MGAAVKPLAKEAWFSDTITKIGQGNSFLGLMLGALLTIVVQSSSAFVGIVQTLHAEKIIPGLATIPMILGSNIGTTITAILASAGASIYAKRTATFHAIFNIVGSLGFLLILPIFSQVIFAAVGGDQWSSALIPTTHVVFNGIMAIIFLPLVSIMDKAITNLVKNKDIDQDEEKLSALDYEIAQNAPTLAIASARNAISSVIKLTNKQTTYVYSLFKSLDKRIVNKSEDTTLAIEQYTNDIMLYLDTISEGHTAPEIQREITNYTLLSRDIISISQLTKSLRENAVDMKSRKKQLSEVAYQEMKITFKLAIKLNKDLVELLQKGFNKKLYDELISDEKQMDEIIVKYKKIQLKRMKSGQATNADLTYLPEIMISITRISDHIKFAADYLVPEHAGSGQVSNKLINKLIKMAD